MTSVVPESQLSRPELKIAAPATWSGVAVASDTRWLRRLSRRLLLLDALLVTAALATALLIRYNLLDRNLVVSDGTLSDLLGRLPFFSDVSQGPRRLSVYVLVGPLLALGWTVMLVFTRAYDGKVLGVGGDEYRRVARASVYFWGLVAIASYMAQFELSRFVLAVSFVMGTFLLLVGRWTARKVLHRARLRSSHLVAPGARRRRQGRGRRPGRRARARALRRAQGGRRLHAAR